MTAITREELFRFLCGPAEIETYDTVEPWPHEPSMGGSFYLPRDIPEPPGEEEFSPLYQLLSRLNANSDHDRGLLLAMMLTLVWGSLPGNRPAFVLTSEHGRGSGKTTTAEVLSSIVGGHIGINPHDRDDRIFSRLLSEKGREYRVVLYDNLKGPLSNAIIEASITSECIQGHRLYHGQDQRKNTLVTIFTANTPQLSTDMAQRAIEIKLGPRQGEDFRTWAFDFVNEHRELIIAELLAILRGQIVEEIDAASLTRWGDWMVAVLSRVAGANALAALIRERCGECDIDAEESSNIATMLGALLHRYEHDPQTATVFIPGRLMLEELSKARLLAAGAQLRAATILVKQHAGSGDLAPLRSHVHGPAAQRVRGWLWIRVGFAWPQDVRGEAILTLGQLARFHRQLVASELVRRIQAGIADQNAVVRRNAYHAVHIAGSAATTCLSLVVGGIRDNDASASNVALQVVGAQAASIVKLRLVPMVLTFLESHCRHPEVGVRKAIATVTRQMQVALGDRNGAETERLKALSDRLKADVSRSVRAEVFSKQGVPNKRRENRRSGQRISKFSKAKKEHQQSSRRERPLTIR